METTTKLSDTERNGISVGARVVETTTRRARRAIETGERIEAVECLLAAQAQIEVLLKALR